MKRRGQMRRKAPLNRRPPTRSKHTPSKPRRSPEPGRDFWSEQRMVLFARSRGLCEIGGEDLNDTGMQAHHRKLRSQGGMHGVENLLAVCPACHRKVHEQPAWARMHGYIVPSVADSRKRAVELHDGRTVRLSEDGTYDVCWDTEEEDESA